MENKNAKNNTKTNMKIDTIKFKNIAIIAFLAFLALVVVYSLFWGPAKKFGDSLTPIRTVSVSAEGKVTVSPDIANISFSVVSEGYDPESVADENNKKMDKAIGFVKSQGIEEKDIKTTQYNLSPRYEYDEDTRETFISGYALTQTVLIKVRDLAKVAKVLGGLPKLGINRIESVSFDIDDSEKYLAEARNKAFEKARAKAENMSAQNRVRLGKVINFYEYQSGPFPYYQEMKTLGLGGGETAPALPQIQPGTQEVTVQVSVIYEIK